jgi:hypothetical protein
MPHQTKGYCYYTGKKFIVTGTSFLIDMNLKLNFDFRRHSNLCLLDRCQLSPEAAIVEALSQSTSNAFIAVSAVSK